MQSGRLRNGCLEGNVSISNRSANSDGGVVKDTCSGSKAIIKDGNVVDGENHETGHFDDYHGGRNDFQHCTAKDDSEASSDVDDDEIDTSSGGNEDKDRVDDAPLAGNDYHVSDSNDNLVVNDKSVVDDVCWKNV